MVGGEIVAGQRGDRFRRSLPAIGMNRVERIPEGLAGDGIGARHGFLEAGDGACLFALEDGGVVTWRLQHVLQDVERRIAFFRGGKRAHGDAGAVGVGAAAQRGADVGQLFGDGGFVARAGAEVECRTRQRSCAGFAGGVEHRAGGEVDLYVEHRQHAAFDEIDAGAARQCPVFDLDAGQRGLRGNEGDDCGQQLFHGHFHQWREAADGRRGLPSSGCGSSTPMVSVSSVKYFFATACTSAALTFCNFSSMRSSFW